MKESVLVTGGGGFLGKAIVRRLVERGDEVYSFSRRFYDELTDMGVIQKSGSLTDLPAVEDACKGMDVVYHTAAKAGVSGTWDAYYDTNVIGTENILQACIRHRVDRLIYTSSPSVIFDGSDMEGVDESVPYPSSYHAPYPETKAMAEKKVIETTTYHKNHPYHHNTPSNDRPSNQPEQSDQRNASSHATDLKSISLRPHLIWGPEDNHLLPGIVKRAKRLKRIGNGNNRVDTIYIDNAADAHLQAADALKNNPELSGSVYFISQDDPISLWEMVDAMLNCAGFPAVQGSVSSGVAEVSGWVIESLYRTLNIKKEPPMTRFMAKELATSHWFDISRAKRDLGYTPTVSTKEGLNNLKQWLQSHPLN